MENDYETYVRRFQINRGKLLISPVQYWEVWARVDREENRERRYILQRFQETFPMLMVPIDQQQAYLAKDARRQFGRGSGHPAQLNMGDCFAYALAKKLSKPLLFKGNDFSHTDVRSAL
ncbi:MAG: type II toxin-antitoxin system VapC family toxin [Pseudomonadota bacterium]